MAFKICKSQKQSCKNLPKENEWDDERQHRYTKDSIAPPGETKEIPTSSIKLIGDRRAINRKEVERLKKSISVEGLFHPITVYPLRGIWKGQFGISAGGHRFAAYKELGVKTIRATIISREAAKRYESSENLYRNELSILDRSEAIVRNARTHEKSETDGPIRGGKQPSDKQYSRLARETGSAERQSQMLFLSLIFQRR
jgi:ParB family chromosome partitioning protein